MIIKDMPKLESPFVRKVIDGQYIVTPEIAEGYEWVFDDENTIATEKLDGTNVSIVIEGGRITRIFNRTSEILFFNKGKTHIVMGVLESFQRGYTNFTDGQYFGELIGEKVQKNSMKVEGHLWIPFCSYAKEHLRYKSWGKYPKDFDTISRWLKDDIFSLFYRRRHSGEVVKPEGVVFYHPDGRMAKLRRDMFSWYTSKSHHRRKV